jgi:hypothetical protein
MIKCSFFIIGIHYLYIVDFRCDNFLSDLAKFNKSDEMILWKLGSRMNWRRKNPAFYKNVV